MYAVVEIAGKQYKVEKGQELMVDLLHSQKKKVSFDTVTVYRGDNDIKIGTPYVPGVTVDVEVVEDEVKGEKITVFKYKPKVNYRVKTGHRQRYTQIKVTGIKEKVAAKEPAEKAETAPKKESADVKSE